MMSVRELRTILSGVMRPGPGQSSSIRDLGDCLQQNKLSRILAETAADIIDDGSDVVKNISDDNSEVVKDLVNVPDRVINNIGVDQTKLPDWIYPGHFCDLILRNIALALRDSIAEEDISDDITVKLLQVILISDCLIQ